jgi:peroxiredoxin Q/BCP
MTLREGDPAPDIRLDTDQGQLFHLKDHLGKNVILYFYPSADTPGCTTESCEFRDATPKFKDAIIIGVSPDTIKAQDKFKTKYELPFTLLADAEHKTAEDYGVWKEKNMYGKKLMGIERTTFIIGKDGRIAKIFNKVKPAGHAAQVLEALP